MKVAGARWAAEECFQAATRAALAAGSSGLPSSANEIRRTLTALCARPVTSSTPAAGHAGAITTKNVHDKATASDNNFKIARPASRGSPNTDSTQRA